MSSGTNQPKRWTSVLYDIDDNIDTEEEWEPSSDDENKSVIASSGSPQSTQTLDDSARSDTDDEPLEKTATATAVHGKAKVGKRGFKDANSGEEDTSDEDYNPASDTSEESSADEVVQKTPAKVDLSSPSVALSPRRSPRPSGPTGTPTVIPSPIKHRRGVIPLDLDDGGVASGNEGPLEEETIAARTRMRAPLPADLELDDFEKQLPETEEDFDFSFMDEDEEYDRFLAFFGEESFQEELFPESEDDDDDDYNPEAEEDEDDDEDDDDEVQVSKQEWSELVDSVREVFADDMMGLQTVLPQRTGDREVRASMLRQGLGEVYDTKQEMMVQMRHHLHMLIENLLASCFLNIPAQGNVIKAKAAEDCCKETRERIIAQLRQLNTVYRTSLRLPSYSHSMTRSAMRSAADAATAAPAGMEPLPATQKEMKNLSKNNLINVPGLHLLPKLLSSYDSLFSSTPTPTPTSRREAKKAMLEWADVFQPFKMYAPPLAPRAGSGWGPRGLKSRVLCFAKTNDDHCSLRRFTAAEDGLLYLGLKQWGRHNWPQIQQHYVPGFHADAIEKRFRSIVSPKVDAEHVITNKHQKDIKAWYDKSRRVCQAWTAAEEQHMVAVFRSYQNPKEQKITEYLDKFREKYPDRSHKSIRNKFQRMKGQMATSAHAMGSNSISPTKNVSGSAGSSTIGGHSQAQALVHKTALPTNSALGSRTSSLRPLRMASYGSVDSDFSNLLGPIGIPLRPTFSSSQDSLSKTGMHMFHFENSVSLSPKRTRVVDESSLERILPRTGYVDASITTRIGPENSQQLAFDIMNFGSDQQQPTNFSRLYNENSLNIPENFEPIAFDVDRLPEDDEPAFDSERLGLNDFDSNSSDAGQSRWLLKKKRPNASTNLPMPVVGTDTYAFSDDSGSRPAESPRKRHCGNGIISDNGDHGASNSGGNPLDDFRAIHHTQVAGETQNSVD